MIHFRFLIALIVLSFFYSIPDTFSQQKVDSLLNILPQSNSKAEIYNQLAESTLEDSLELSMQYALLGLEYSKSENNTRQEGIAMFSIAEVYSFDYQIDSAVNYYTKALVLLKQANDAYYVSYTLNNLGWIYNSYGKYEEAIKNYLECTRFLDAEKHSDDLANVYINIGSSYHQIGSYQTAINYFHKACSLIRKLDEQTALPIAYNGLGLSYKYFSNFDSAIYYYNATLNLDKKSGNLYDQATDFGNIGALYFDWKQYQQAFKFYNRALQIYFEKGNKNDLSVSYNNIGEVYKAMQNYDSSLFYLNKALEIDQQTGMKQNIASRYHNLGEVYFDQKEYQKALSQYNQSLQINTQNGSRYNIALNLKSIAQANQKTGNTKKAERLYKESLKIAKEIDSKTLIKSVLEALSEFYTETKQYANALHYHALVDTLNDSMFKEKNQQLLADLQTRYELDSKQKEIALLNSENELRSQEAKQYRSYSIIFASALLLISALLIVLFTQYNLRKKAYKKLVQKNIELIKSKKGVVLNDINKPEIVSDSYQVKLENGNHKELFEKIKTHLEQEKPFLQPELTVKDLAEQLDTNTHYLSEVINRDFGNSFNGFINEYRVREACKLLSDKNMDNLTIEGIARESGFNSKSAFNNAFKSVTGLTPSYYKSQVRKA